MDDDMRELERERLRRVSTREPQRDRTVPPTKPERGGRMRLAEATDERLGKGKS